MLGRLFCCSRLCADPNSFQGMRFADTDSLLIRGGELRQRQDELAHCNKTYFSLMELQSATPNEDVILHNKLRDLISQNERQRANLISIINILELGNRDLEETSF